MFEVTLTVLAICTWGVLVSFVVLTFVVWKMALELKALTESCRRWVEIYFPPHINQAAQQKPAGSGQTQVTINKGWDEEEPPRD